MIRTFWKRLALAAFILAEGGAAASAATDVCTDLQARLDALNRSGSSSQETYRVYDAQVNAQRAALDRATNDARANGCFGGFFSPQPTARCPQLVGNINALQGNVNRLTAQRDQYRVDPFTVTSQRNDVLRLLSLNRCGNFAAYDQPPQPVGFFASLFGGFGTFGNGYYGDPYGYGNTYRTLCVRSCDGFYFPISFSTTTDRFQADQQACQAACPGTAVSLYVHRNPGEEVESMVSLSGTRYSNLPTAFKYRTNYDASCSCGAATPSVMEQLTAQAAALTPQNAPYGTLPPVSIPGANATFYPLVPAPTGQVVMVPIPSLRPARSEDPETLSGRAGSLTPRPIIDQPGQLVAGVREDGRPIRVVGPTYYIAQ
jgi:hypothetical protein